ncbi:hypothetical protein FSARC_14164 [Fusarium sarcochroum]|uniref:Methyl transferase n=1 Tax=Fusarium sarcochroum TaxID=1208366 RepID=A0A8H4WQR0_9HYPO|nr:hypothetical protein FSARC_14164 [Fusarium sarcochroum]
MHSNVGPLTGGMSSRVEPVTEYLEEGYWEYGRFFGSWKRGKYLFPIDSEESDRLDIFHKFFLEARGRLFSAPIVKMPSKIMDLGTGTGIWPIDVADLYITAEVMAVDLNRIQPALLRIPENLVLKQFDIEERAWTSLLTGCDLIHMRMLLGSIQTDLWPQIYGNVFEHLIPGHGYIEQVEIDWIPRREGNSKPEYSSFPEWSERFLSSMDKLNRSARVAPENIQWLMRTAGFTDIKQKIIPVSLSPWSSVPHERSVARWFNAVLSRSLESLSMLPLIKKQGDTREEVHELCDKVKREICVLSNHGYCNIYVWTARKPAGSFSDVQDG